MFPKFTFVILNFNKTKTMKLNLCIRKLKEFAMLSVFMTILSLCISCKKNTDTASNNTKTDTTTIAVKPSDTLKIYKPKEMATMDWNADTSKFSLSRSKQSKHFILFWSKEYGSNIPSSANVPSKYRVDIDDFLAKAESFYDINVNRLKFAVVGQHQSNLDKYKILIFLYYQDDWLATGAGYNDTIGALWVSPSTCQPVGSTIAHEIGHSFQYQTSCDLGLTHGFRYGYGGGGGNTFWEQCAQWQSFQSYPMEAFTAWHFSEYINNYNKHLLHEDYRYASYFIHYYWAQKYGIDIIAKLWRQSVQPEDAIQAYQRLTNISNDQFNDEVYDASSKFVTWDLDSLRSIGKKYIGTQIYKMNRQSDGSFVPDYTFCPQSTGYNALPLNVPDGGTAISAAFTGMPNAQGYNQGDVSNAGWRYGFVALLKDGSRVYSSMYKKNIGFREICCSCQL